jgi:hypothetical protein
VAQRRRKRIRQHLTRALRDLRHVRRKIWAFIGLVGAAALTAVVGAVVTDTKESIGAPDPVEVQVEVAGERDVLGQPSRDTPTSYVLPLEGRALPPPPVQTTSRAVTTSCTREWAQRVGGADAYETVFTVYVEGRSDRTVILDRVDARVVGRAPAMNGSVISCLPPGMAMPTRTLSVDLDAEPATVTYVPGPDPRSRDYDVRSLLRRRRPAPFLFKLPRGEVEAFRVYATARTCWCTWTLRFGYLVGGDRRTVEVRDVDDSPFTTSGIGPGAEPMRWSGREWQIARVP